MKAMIAGAAILFATGVAFGWGGYRDFGPEECFTGKFIIESSMYGAVVMGDQSICGSGLHFTSMTGPSKLQGGAVERPDGSSIPIS